MKLKSLALAALTAVVALLAPAPTRAAALECDQRTTGFRLCVPRYGTDFDQWAMSDIAALDVLNSSGSVNSTTSVHTADWLMVRRISGVSTAPANGIQFSSAVYQDSGFYFMTRSSASFLGPQVGVLYGISAATGAFTSDLSVGGTLTGTLGARFDGAGGVQASSFTATYGVKAATGNFTSDLAVGGTLTGTLGALFSGAGGVAASSFTATYGVKAATGNFTSNLDVGGTVTGTLGARFNGSGGVQASSFTATYGISAATGAFTGNVSVASITTTGTGASAPFTITSSSGVRVNSGAIEMGTGGFLRFSDGSTLATAPSASGTSILAKSTICVTNALVTASTVIPRDDTIPQKTEGDEILTCTMTPTSANNRLRVTATGWFCTPSTGYKTGAIFRDTTANALKAADIGGYPADNCSNFSIVQEDAAAAASATTYKLRIGPSSALNVYVNGTGAARLFGGVGGTSIQIDEIVP